MRTRNVFDPLVYVIEVGVIIKIPPKINQPINQLTNQKLIEENITR